MQKSKPRTDFGELLARSWQLYGRSLGATFPAALLCDVLPVGIVLTAIYYGLVSAFEPAVRVAQAMLRSLLQNGFDEWAVGAAVEQVMGSLGGTGFLQTLFRMLGSFGGLAIALALLLPAFLACRILLTPYGRGLSMQALSLHVKERPVRLSKRYAAYKPLIGRMIALELISLPPAAALIAVASGLSKLLVKIPAVGQAASLCAFLAALTAVICIRLLMTRIILTQNADVFHAFSQAVGCFFTDWTYLAAGALFFVGLAGCALLVAVADVMLMILVLIPPVSLMLLYALAMPLLQSIVTVLHEEQQSRKQSLIQE